MPNLQTNLISVKRLRTTAIWLTIGLAITTAVLTLIPISIPQGVPGSDKIYHVLAFVALILPCATLYPKALLKVGIAAALYGGAIEVIQPHIGRSGELADFLADLLGIGFGASFGLFFHLVLKTGLSRGAVGVPPSGSPF